MIGLNPLQDRARNDEQYFCMAHALEWHIFAHLPRSFCSFILKGKGKIQGSEVKIESERSVGGWDMSEIGIWSKHVPSALPRRRVRTYHRLFPQSVFVNYLGRLWWARAHTGAGSQRHRKTQNCAPTHHVYTYMQISSARGAFPICR